MAGAVRTCSRSVTSAGQPRRTERRNRSILIYVRIPSTARRRLTGAQLDREPVLRAALLFSFIYLAFIHVQHAPARIRAIGALFCYSAGVLKRFVRSAAEFA